MPPGMAAKEMKIIITSQIVSLILGITTLYVMATVKTAARPGVAYPVLITNKIRIQIDQSKPPFTFPKFDEYGNLPFAEEKKRLDYFAQELKGVPGEPGYIIEYRGKGQRQKPLSRAKRAKGYLVKTKGIASKRLFIVDGGCGEEFKVELRLGPTNMN